MTQKHDKYKQPLNVGDEVIFAGHGAPIGQPEGIYMGKIKRICKVTVVCVPKKDPSDSPNWYEEYQSRELYAYPGEIISMQPLIDFTRGGP